MNKMMLMVGATLTAFAAATAGTLPTEYGNPANDIASGSVPGLTWAGAARAYKIGTDVVLVFTNTTEGVCSFALDSGKRATANCLLVGGGGPGGNGGSNCAGAGGGAGGFVELKDLMFEGAIAVTVGKGGEPVASGTQACNADGTPSRLVRSGEELAKALGGGGGGHFQGGDWRYSCGNPYANCWVSDTEYDYSKSTVASGGGGCYSTSWGTSYAQFGGLVQNDQGNNGGDTWEKMHGGGETWRSPGGGGGAGTAAKVQENQWIGGAGGDGRQSDITGSSVYYAGGGAGGCGCYDREAKSVAGGLGGGGSSSWDTTGDAPVGESKQGADGFGGGGAGSSAAKGEPFAGVWTAAGRGGNGVVVIRITEISSGEGPLDGVTFSGETEWFNIGTGKDRQTVVVFTNPDADCALTLATDAEARILLVGGGGPGGNGGSDYAGAGGGAGGFIELGEQALSRGTYAITVGKGGEPVAVNTNSRNNDGAPSIFKNRNGEIFVDQSGKLAKALGGGGGGFVQPSNWKFSCGNPYGDCWVSDAEYDYSKSTVASGGGGCYLTGAYPGPQFGGLVQNDQGNNGGDNGAKSFGESNWQTPGGGGGAGTAAKVQENQWIGGAGGDGRQSDITGSPVYYAGGGAGGCGCYDREAKSVAGGLGGGGSASWDTTGGAPVGESKQGADGFGGGGAGSSATRAGPFAGQCTAAGRGGNGAVIVRVTKIRPLGFTVIVR